MAENITCLLLAPLSGDFSRNVFEEWGAGGIAFLTIPALLTAVLLAVYAEEVVYILKKGDSKELINSFCWLLGTHPAIMVLGTIGIFIPRSVVFLAYMYNVYVAYAIYKYYYLVMIFSGGTFSFVQKSCEKPFGLNQTPCCCLVCLPSIHNTARTTNIAKWFILQNSISSLLIGALATILKSDWNLYNFEGVSASLILSIVNGLTTLLCMYGFKLIDKISKNIEGMQEIHALKGKTKCMQLTLFIVGFEGSIFNILEEFGLFPCISPLNFISRTKVIFNYAVVLQVFFLGFVARHFYRRKSDIQRQAILTDNLTSNSDDPNLNLTDVEAYNKQPSYNGVGRVSLHSSRTSLASATGEKEISGDTVSTSA